MKYLLRILTLVLTPSLLLGQTLDRATLLAPSGALYTVESVADTPTERHLVLVVQAPDAVMTMNVPGTAKGIHSQPQLAFDAGSNTLFVLWIARATISGFGEVRYCTFQNGQWSAASAVDAVPEHAQFNIGAGVTRLVAVTNSDDGSVKEVPAFALHITWWDASNTREVARYAMLNFDDGNVTDVYRCDLTNFVTSTERRQVDEQSREILRHPQVFESARHDSIDVVFGDNDTNALHRVTLKPTIQSRVRIPVGIRDVSYPPTRMFLTGTDSQVSAIPTVGDRLLFYYPVGGAVRYLLFDNGAWNDNTITINDKITSDAAVTALRRMAREY